MKDLSGRPFGKLTVLRFSHRKGKRYFWLCECKCGRTKAINRDNLVNGRTNSCGCWEAESKIGRRKTHGGRNSAEYNCWAAMRQRCLNKSCEAYPKYGGAGVTICKQWSAFENFLADMGKRPSRQHSIDRFPDPFGNYEPSNCRWATTTQQNRNRRKHMVIEHNGTAMILSEWSERTGIDSGTIYARLKRGQSVAKALGTPATKVVPNAAKTHCDHGHEFTPENTYVYKSGPREGTRKCRTCDRLTMRKIRSRRKH